MNNFVQLPKENIKCLNYYVHNRYRKPYRYPFQIVKEHPIKYLSYLDKKKIFVNYIK